jgi:NmrA-like family
MRIFELALEAGVQHYIWSGLDSALKLSGYDEALRCGHYEGKAKVTEWLKAQPQRPMVWSVLTTGPYAEMLSASQGPKRDENGVYVFRAPLGEGAVPYIHLDDLAQYAKWLFDHPEESAGIDLQVATEHVGWGYLAETFERVTGKKARYEAVSVEERMPKEWKMGDVKLGAEYEGENDDTLLTFRENFSAWWRIYQRSGGNKGVLRRDYELLDRILPGRVKTIGEWMVKVGYTGDEKKLLLNNGGQGIFQ